MRSTAQHLVSGMSFAPTWVPAFAGVTKKGGSKGFSAACQAFDVALSRPCIAQMGIVGSEQKP
jgi:hypothetical protein